MSERSAVPFAKLPDNWIRFSEKSGCSDRYPSNFSRIRVIQVLLGHKKLETTSIYAHVATDLLREVIGPLEPMPAA